MDLIKEGIDEAYGITLSSLRSLGTSVYSLGENQYDERDVAGLTYEACLKNLRGRSRP